MTFDLAKMICTSRTPEDAWKLIRAHRQAFVWSDDEDLVSALNRIVAIVTGDIKFTTMADRENFQRISLKDRIVDVQLNLDRNDRLRIIYATAQVLRPDFDVRLCRDSTHSSDIAFLAMPSTEWDDLKSKVGAEKVAAHFLSMDSTFNDFFESAFAAPDVHKGTLAPEMTDWEGGSSYEPAKLEYCIVWDGPGQIRIGALQAVIHRYLEAGMVDVSYMQSSAKLTVKRDMLPEAIAKRIGGSQIRMSNSTRTGFVVIESNGVAAGWRTDGWQPKDDTPRKWWQVWGCQNRSGESH